MREYIKAYEEWKAKCVIDDLNRSKQDWDKLLGHHKLFSAQYLNDPATPNRSE